jgi:hypothetical protein
MTREPTPPDRISDTLYRSEAFAEDLDGLLPEASASSGGARRLVRPVWLFALPLAVLVIGSVSALAWA